LYNQATEARPIIGGLPSLAFKEENLMHWYMEKHKQPPKMPKQETEALLSELRELHKDAMMKNANFSRGSKENPTKFIKERTHLWRRTWLIIPLERLIERYERALK
jgi:hypothetical protein